MKTNRERRETIGKKGDTEKSVDFIPIPCRENDFTAPALQSVEEESPPFSSPKCTYTLDRQVPGSRTDTLPALST